MKKIIITILGGLLLMSACTRYELPQIDQNPYRKIVEYTPGTATMEVPGTLTPDENYDWITVSNSGSTASFTMRRNTTGLMRTATFTIAGESYKAMIFQKEHSLDASLSTSIVSQGLGSITAEVSLTTDYFDDYTSWGFAYGKSADLASAKDAPQSAKLINGKNIGEITGLESEVDYYIWGYVVSTEGDKVYSDMKAVISPVFFKAGENLQEAINGAKEYAEIRVQGGVTFPGVIKFTNANKNKSVSGGWNADFTEQSFDNLTIIDGAGENRGFWCAEDDNTPLTGYVNISYFELVNCYGDHGSGVHVTGGPVTIHHCYVHDNECVKGAIGTREEDFSSDITVYNCIVSNNRADGHGAAFGFGDGASTDDPVHAVIVNNLIVDNFSYSFGGYCSTFICYNNTDLVFVNNTVVGNMNYMEGDGLYPGTNFRGDVRCVLANNIFAGNLTSADELDPPVFVRQKQHLSLGGGQEQLVNNIIEDEVGECANATFKDNYMPALGFDLQTVMADPANGNYMPVGKALGLGSLAKITYAGNGFASTAECDLKALLTKYDKDLAGNPRVVNGKVDAGCFQAQ